MMMFVVCYFKAGDSNTNPFIARLEVMRFLESQQLYLRINVLSLCWAKRTCLYCRMMLWSLLGIVIIFIQWCDDIVSYEISTSGEIWTNVVWVSRFNLGINKGTFTGVKYWTWLVLHLSILILISTWYLHIYYKISLHNVYIPLSILWTS